jgi:hypothetical protein
MKDYVPITSMNSASGVCEKKCVGGGGLRSANVRVGLRPR